MTDTLLYLTYGEGRHLDQVVYAILSARAHGAMVPRCRVVVYTDRPETVGSLSVEVVPLTRDVLAEWAGPHNFNHRRKIFAIRDALRQFGGRVVYCDADTYVRRDPRALFRRIGPGQSVMHIREGDLRRCHAGDIAAFLEHHDLRTRVGRRWDIGPATPMFNAGVIGLHAADVALLDEVVHLTDQIYPNVRLHTIEQFAFSACLAQRTRLREAYDIVYHYWPSSAVFSEHLGRILREPGRASLEERFLRLQSYRPVSSQRTVNRFRQRLRDRLRGWLRRSAQRAGLLGIWQRAARRSRTAQVRQ